MVNHLQTLEYLNKLRRQAAHIKKHLIDEEIKVERDGMVVVISGDQKIKRFSINGMASQPVIDILNEALHKTQELIADRLQKVNKEK